MASTPTTRNRLEKQGAGENASTWGAPKLNTVIDLTDTALDGWSTKALTGNVVLTSTNYAADESRARILKFTGTGSYQVTIPSVEKWYIIDNQLTGTLTVTAGGVAGTVATGVSALITCDGTNVKAFVLPAFTPANKAGDTFLGPLLAGDANFGFRLAGGTTGDPIINLASNAYIGYNRTTGLLTFVIGVTAVASINFITGEIRSLAAITGNTTV